MSLNARRWIVVSGFVVAVSAVTLSWSAATGYQEASATDYQQLNKFSQIMDMVRKSYVDEVSDEKLIEGALSGMLSSLDPHSTYMNKEMFKQMQVETTGEFGGLGIEIAPAQGGIRIVAPIEDTPADRAGIKAGDLIIKIDAELAKDMTLPEAVDKMRGKPGTSITLTIFRTSEPRPLEVKLSRDVIRVKSVKSDLLAPGFAYLRITQFQEHTSEQLEKQIKELMQRSGGNLHGAVLDLRNNPGGLLDQAVEVSDLFLDSGDIVSTKSRIGKNMSFQAEKGDILSGKPLIVLINNGSASASEIVSGALQDNHRAALLGTKSFGKGSVQRIIPLQDGSAFKLTTSLYYTPSGRSIQATGIEPDIHVEPVILEAKKADNALPSISEKDLKGHLANGNGKQPAKKGAEKAADDAASQAMQERLMRDAQLQRAFDLLKGLDVLKQG